MMSEDQPTQRPVPEAGPDQESKGGVGRARQLLDRVGRLAREAREAAEGLVGRLLSGTVAGAAGRSAPEPEPEPVREPELEHMPEHLLGDGQGKGDPGRVVLVSRDPEWIFCYWDLAQATREAARIPGSRLTLRLQDVTDIDFDGSNGWSQHLYPLTEEARWWHVPVPQSGRRYLAEVGYCTREGTFFALGRSESVATLSDRMDPSPEVEAEMATVHLDAPLTEQVPHRSEERRASQNEDGDERERVSGDERQPETLNAGRIASGADCCMLSSAPGVGGSVPVSHLGSSAIWSKRR